MEQTIQLNEHNKQEYPPMHTCEHIINQTMIRLFGCGRSVSAHIERKKSKLDYRLTACPTEEQIKNLENAVNQIIMQHLPVTTEFITQEEAKGRFDLKRLPEDASETVRVVKVGDYDECLWDIQFIKSILFFIQTYDVFYISGKKLMPWLGVVNVNCGK